MTTHELTAQQLQNRFELRAKLRLAETEVEELQQQLERAEARVRFYARVLATIEGEVNG